MTIHSPWLKVLLIFFAVIGVLVVLAFTGMVFMHGGMMAFFPEMTAACKSMMQAYL